jgi:hypothetical protein
VTDIGPSYQTKRKEAVTTQLDLLKVMPPQMAANTLDIVVSNMDIPQSKEFAERVKRMIPPQILGGDDSDPEVRMQKMQATLDQAMQQHQLLTKALQDAQKTIETKAVEQQGKVAIAQLQEQSAQAIAKMKIDAEIVVAEINTKAQESQLRMEMEREIWKETHGAAHELGMQNDQQAHEKQLAQQQAAQAAQSQQSDQQHELGMAAVNQDHEQQMAEQTQGGE